VSNVGLAWMHTSFRGAGPVVRKPVRRVGRDDHDVAGAGGQPLLAGPEGEVACDDDPGLVVGVAMQPWAVPGLALVENERDAGAVVFAHDVPGGDRVGLDQGHAVTLSADVVPVRRAYHAAHG